MSIATRYSRLEQELAVACRGCGRDRNDVVLVAVSKTVGIDEVREAASAGAHDFGENRPDQLMEKHDQYPGATWHFIGNIQSRRISDIVGRATLIHSLYQQRHADKIDAVAREKGIVQDVLIEVNVSGEESKSGLAPHDVEAMLVHCLNLSNLRVRGLMTMAPRGDSQRVQTSFEGLAALRDELAARYASGQDEAFLHDLSMGMSEDWREGVIAGATIVRIGRAVFDDAFDEADVSQ